MLRKNTPQGGPPYFTRSGRIESRQMGGHVLAVMGNESLHPRIKEMLYTVPGIGY